MSSGWLVWPETYPAFLAPDSTQFSPPSWEAGSQEALKALREVTLKPSFWKDLSTHYSSENHSDVCVQDNISCVKSICELFAVMVSERCLSNRTVQVLHDEPFEALRPTIEKLLDDTEKNKQRGAAEFLAGVIGGSKHWPTDKQMKLWEWFVPYIPKILGLRNNDVIPIWTSFLSVRLVLRIQRRKRTIDKPASSISSRPEIHGECNHSSTRLSRTSIIPTSTASQQLTPLGLSVTSGHCMSSSDGNSLHGWTTRFADIGAISLANMTMCVVDRPLLYCTDIDVVGSSVYQRVHDNLCEDDGRSSSFTSVWRNAECIIISGNPIHPSAPLKHS